VVISGVIANNAVGNSVAAGLIYSGTGSLTVNGGNTFNGGTTISSGVLATNNLAATGSASGIGAGSAVNIGATGTLRYTGGTFANFNRDLSGTTGYTIDVTQATTTLTSTATLVSGGLVKAGLGKLVLAGSGATGGASVTAGTLALAGADNGFSGSAVIAGGTLQLNKPSSSNLIHDATDVSISSGTFDLNGQSEKIGGLLGSGGEVTNNAGSGTSSTLTVSGFAHSTNYGGVIRDGATGGKVAFVQTDANSATTLSGINIYSGNTSINSATASLRLADNAGLKFVIGAAGVNNQINGSGILTLDGDFTFDLTGAGTTLGASWTIVNNGTLSETYSSTFSVIGFTENADVWRMTTGGGTIYQFSESTGLLQVVPEPASLSLVLAGGTLLRRKRPRRG
jgi:autotransporter-associated beta strand protein